MQWLACRLAPTQTTSSGSSVQLPQNYTGSLNFDGLVFPIDDAVAPRKASAAAKSVRQDPVPHNAPIPTWILRFLCILLLMALISLGIGFGIKWNPAEDMTKALQLGNANANFNYSSYFSIQLSPGS
jgi:hypothetical protein